MSPAKRALLAQRLRSRRAGASDDIPQSAGRASGPLSFAQQRLWFLNRFEGQNSAYHMRGAIRLRGHLNLDALERAFLELVARHGSLRTRFVEMDGERVQSLDPDPRIDVRVEDLGMLAGQAQVDALAAAMRREHESPFDLSQGPLLRTTLLKLGPREHVLAWTLHHIVSDGWSVGVFKRELAALYGAFCEGRRSPLEPLPIQYVDYAAWQRHRLQGDTLERLLAYWTRKLDGAPPLLALPTDSPRASQRGRPAGKSRTLDLPPDLAASLSALCQREGVTLFMALLGAFEVVLARCSGQEDIVIGTPIAGRDRVELENLIGFFINTVVLRTDLSGNPTFEELLARVRRTALEAFEHQDLPFEKLIEELHVERNLSHTPVFQVFFNLLNMEEVTASFSGLEVEKVPLPEPEAKFDLTLYAMKAGGTIRLRAVYRSELFHGDTIERMLDQLHLLLEQIVVNPAAGILSHTLVLPRDRTVLPDPMGPLHRNEEIAIHDAFAAQVKRGPRRTAVVDSEGEWTYEELAAVSSRLANYLRGEGVRSGDVVAVHASPSAALIWCMLGIMKAGGAFLILDSAYPAVRLRRYLEKARPCALLSLRSAGALPGVIEEFAASGRVRCRLDIPTGNARSVEDFLSHCDATDPGVAVAGGDRAYVVFTSGSTGEPLAVLGSHAPVSHFLRWHIGTFGLRDDDRFSLLSGLAHDPLLRDVFTPLWLGASLHIPSAAVRDTPGSMARWMRGEKISVCHATPALAEFLAESAGTVGALDAVRWMFLGGDRLTHDLLQRIRNSAPSCRLVNLYGTTETPQAMGFHRVDMEASPGQPPGQGVPIGKGIDGAQLLLLNQAGQRAGIGELAEICVRTPYLSHGYLDEPSLTSERFLDNPFTSAAGDRIYRTGDMGRYLPDGSVAFAGRRDQQLTLRGFRIELTEVETALRNCSGVREAVVLARKDTPGDTRLVAYVVPADMSGADPEPLRAFLRERLPDYMRPAAYVVLERLPLTPNGKVDRKALPAPVMAALARRAYEPPVGEIETILAQMWADVLTLERVGRHDNFFDIGGHSLLAVDFVSRLRDQAGVELPIGMLFESPTPAALAERLSIEPQSAGAAEAGSRAARRLAVQQPAKAVAGQVDSPIAEILGKQLEWVRRWKGSRSTPGSCIVTLNESGTRQGLFWCLQAYRELAQLARHLGSDQPVHGMRSGHHVMKYTDENVDALASHYAAEMVVSQPEGSFLLGGNCQGGRIARAIALRLHELGRTVSLLVLMEQGTFPPYDDPVALIFGRDSRVNPYKLDADPDAVFRRAYPAGFTVDIIEGAHGKFFHSPNVETLALALKRRLPTHPD